MIEESGTVVDLNDDGIWVETVKESACGSCAVRNGCGQKLLASAGDGKSFVVNVSNPSHLQVNTNDSVLIGVEEGAFLKATLYVYLVPLLALFLGALVGELLSLTEGYIILCALLSLIVSLFGIRFFSKVLFRSCKYQPVLLKIN
ncbi:MAG: SoxR reducing system RseC family protein [Neptuniibacter sp.]